MKTFDIIIFTGPSLAPPEAKQLLPHALILPPVQCGDIVRALRLQPKIIGIIDGYFERTAAVWHKEILFALSQGVAVLGASSMGALRAAELNAYGMMGIGKVFNLYHSGEIIDDDEVTLVHDAYFNTSNTPMVNVRITLEALFKRRLIDKDTHQQLLQTTKSMPYTERNVFKAAEKLNLSSQTQALLKHAYVDQKKLDAEQLLSTINQQMFTRHPHKHHHSLFFDKIYRLMSVTPFPKETALNLGQEEIAWSQQLEQIEHTQKWLHLTRLLQILDDLIRTHYQKSDTYRALTTQQLPARQYAQRLLEWATQQTHPELEMSVLRKHLYIYYGQRLSHACSLIDTTTTVLAALIVYLLRHDIFISQVKGQHFANVFCQQKELNTLESTQNWMQTNGLADMRAFSLFIMQMSVLHYTCEEGNVNLLNIESHFTPLHWPSLTLELFSATEMTSTLLE